MEATDVLTYKNRYIIGHIHRRLRWLNNKLASHVITLTYLAIWHGYHLGYFLLFGIELGCVQAQNQLYALIKRTPGWTEAISQPIARPFIWLFGKITISYSMGFAKFIGSKDANSTFQRFKKKKT
ncbi:hypothetical protein GCK72_011532 [Caenorhabditis remanei]|uniref:Lysophospholipid acyltransferase 5 n=1 Tax=Caenorhabditis remanei TaxID=31234 RepID=A0A6A5H8Q5_CAERE|nr:hypothetical protein GCK72_011532 [Caenorhabditis remanei]KAF1763266.1 hypothetical protein GCK72_011532 [Caenorhabditis remanei]